MARFVSLPAPPSAERRLKLARVLVVEPDSALRATLRELLAEDGGHVVDEARDGTEAIGRLAVSLEPVVVVVNAHLSGFHNALYLLELAHRRQLRRFTFVILSTDDPTHISQALSRWCTLLDVPIVWMPFDSDELFNAIAKVSHQRWSP